MCAWPCHFFTIALSPPSQWWIENSVSGCPERIFSFSRSVRQTLSFSIVVNFLIKESRTTHIPIAINYHSWKLLFFYFGFRERETFQQKTALGSKEAGKRWKTLGMRKFWRQSIQKQFFVGSLFHRGNAHSGVQTHTHSALMELTICPRLEQVSVRCRRSDRGVSERKE